MITAILREHGQNSSLFGSDDDQDEAPRGDRLQMLDELDHHVGRIGELHGQLRDMEDDGQGDEDEAADDQDGGADARESREDRLRDWATSLREGRRPPNHARLQRFVRQLKGTHHGR
jgi:hypothetical protein